MLSLHNVCLGYGGTPVLEDLSLQAAPGTITALLGPNGAGKSTLLRAVFGLLPYQGEIQINGRAVAAIKRGDMARLVSFLPQDTQSHAVLSVLEVVLLGRLENLSWRVGHDDLAAVHSLLGEMGLDHLSARFLNELSGGQRQMVYIAQALLRDPQVLLLDEPTSALDLQHQLEILALIERTTAARGAVTVMAMHDLNLAARFADRLAVIGGGGLYGIGDARQMLTPAMLREVYHVEAVVDQGADGIVTIKPLRALSAAQG